MNYLGAWFIHNAHLDSVQYWVTLQGLKQDIQKHCLQENSNVTELWRLCYFRCLILQCVNMYLKRACTHEWVIQACAHLFSRVFEFWVHELGVEGLVEPSGYCLSRFHDLEQQYKGLDPSR